MISFQVSQTKYSNTKIMYDDQDYQHINQNHRVQAKRDFKIAQNYQFFERFASVAAKLVKNCTQIPRVKFHTTWALKYSHGHQLFTKALFTF